MNDLIAQLQIKDLVAIVTGVTGMILGIYNFVHSRRQDSVRLHVIPKASSYQGRGIDGREFYLDSVDEYSLEGRKAADTLAIEIVNMSKFPVTVDDVGLAPRRGNRMALAWPLIKDGGAWPRKLEPREAVTVYFDPAKTLELDGIATVKTAYASTVCGTTVFGTSNALRDYIRIAAGIRS